METGKQTIYIGQAVMRKSGEGLLCCIDRHKQNDGRDTDWDTAIALTTQNNFLGPTEIGYLENQFIDLAVRARCYEVVNRNDPGRERMAEEKESELSEYVEYVRMIMGVMGHTVFEPVMPHSAPRTAVLDETLIFRYTGKLNARVVWKKQGFLLLKGSEVSAKISASIPEIAEKARKRYAGKIINGKTVEDILFSSPSAAAAFVGGCSLSGNEMWRTSGDKSPKELFRPI